MKIYTDVVVLRHECMISLKQTEMHRPTLRAPMRIFSLSVFLFLLFPCCDFP